MTTENSALMEALRKSRTLFERYGKEHRAKAEKHRKDDSLLLEPYRSANANASDRKAETNEAMVDEIDAALSRPTQSSGDAMRSIDLLRADEGDSVTILCDNPGDFDISYNVAIDCNGGWTGWIDRRFTGKDVADCLRQAVNERAAIGDNYPAPLPAERGDVGEIWEGPAYEYGYTWGPVEKREAFEHLLQGYSHAKAMNVGGGSDNSAALREQFVQDVLTLFAPAQPVSEKGEGWKPIESAPKDGTAILALLMDSDLPHTIRFRDGQWIIAWDGFDLTSNSDRPTHWIPLPAAPQTDGGEA